MSMRFEWPNAGDDLPVKGIFFNPANRTLTVQFRSDEQAAAAEAAFRLFDAGSERHDEVMVMSRGSNPALLGSYLLEQEMIGQECYDEMQKDLKEYRREMGSDGRGP